MERHRRKCGVLEDAEENAESARNFSRMTGCTKHRSHTTETHLWHARTINGEKGDPVKSRLAELDQWGLLSTGRKGNLEYGQKNGARREDKTEH